MNVEMIGALVNDLVSNATNGEYNTVKAENIVSIGDVILNSATDTEKFYNALVDRIGKVIVKSIEYIPNERGVRIDALDFGVALQKIRFEMGEFSDSSTYWDSTDSQFDPFSNTPNTKAYSKIYKKFTEYEYRDLIVDHQLKSAFVDMAHMGAFLSGLYITRQNALKVALKELDATAINFAIAKTVEKGVEDSSLYSINALSKFNHEINGLDVTISNDAIVFPDGWIKESDLETPKAKEFWKWFTREIKEKINHVKDMTTLYNPDGKQTLSSDPVVEVIGKAASACKVYVESDTYHNDIVSLPNYNEVDHWMTIGDESFASVTQISMEEADDDDDTVTVDVSNVIAHIRDKDTVMSMVRNFREKSIYNPAAEVTNTFDKATLGYMCDLSETSVVYTVNDPIIDDSGEESTVDYLLNGLIEKA